MDENITKMIRGRFDDLPEIIQNLILSSHYQDTLLEIGKKYQLNIEQLGMLEQETTLVMMGLTPTKDFETELTRELGVDKMKGNQIVTEINEKIFLTIRDLLKLMYTPEGEEPSIEEEKEAEISPDKGRREGLNLESREELLKKIENPESINNYELRINNEKKNNEQLGITNYELEITDGKPTKTITDDQLRIKNLEEKNEKTQSILGQKLSGVFQVPKTETDHSLGNISPNNTPSSVPKVDPYREPTE